MIELFKIIKGMYDSTCVPHLDLMKISDDLIGTRGNQYKLIQHHCNYDLRKYNFTNRVIPIWNSLSNWGIRWRVTLAPPGEYDGMIYTAVVMRALAAVTVASCSYCR